MVKLTHVKFKTVAADQGLDQLVIGHRRVAVE